MSHRRLLLTTDVVGGVWDFCLALTEALVGLEHSVSLLALGSPTPQQSVDARRAGAQLFSVPLRLEWMADSAADVEKTPWVVAEIARQVQADVVHANQFAAACADLDIPVVLTLHSDVLSWRRWTVGSGDTPTEWRAYAALVRRAVERADAVVAVSRFLAQQVATLYGVVRPIEVIHNGWSPARVSLRERSVTLIAGRIWDQAKNVSLVAEAARGWPHPPVFLAGESRHPDGGRAEIPPPLQALGFLARSELDDWLARAQIYISPARYDPFGLLPLQAALQGCALLLSDVPSYREIWDGAAEFFRSNDSADLREHWQVLVHDSARLAEVQAACHERAARCYTAKTMADAYAHIYASMHTEVAA